MRLTSTLHQYLNRVWSRDPKAVSAFTIVHAGPMSWEIADQVLTITVTGGLGSSLVVDLTQYTIGGLASLLAAHGGYSVVGLNAAVASLSAMALLDGGADQSKPLQAYTSLRWAVLDAIAQELQAAEAAAAAAPAQLSTTTASGYWLDLLGGYLGGCIRIPGEQDAIYGPRIIAQILQPKGNNVAIAATLEALFGMTSVTVTDVTVYGPVAPTFNGAIDFDGSHVFNAEPTVAYGLFDVTALYDGPIPAAILSPAVLTVLEALRAAGTHARNLNIYSTLTTIAGDPILTSSGDSIQVSAI